jgi:hypothetical protein
VSAEPAADLPLTLQLLPGSYAVCRLPADAPLPPLDPASGILSVTRTSEELSVVCPEESAPAACPRQTGWRCLRVSGTLDLALVGILARLTAPLAAAAVPVFALSTHDTDYLLIPGRSLGQGLAALSRAGIGVEAREVTS